ncbi:MAG: hypothetical protein PHU23_02545 [Dehalococcoidales bacterium]|nr:hypothetical protein [Dehalococcoidales bacterium]
MNIFEGTVIPSIIVIAGYLFTLLTSGLVVRGVLRIVRSGRTDPNKAKYDTGFIIGKCENVITLTLVLLSAFTALALIFTAKSIVRLEDIKKDPRYYLGGTMVNFTYSLLMGVLIRFAINLTQSLIQG